MTRISGPKIGVALGGGAARGLTHIPFIEAIDELGLRPSLIAGTSIGSLLGSAWAAGFEGREIRELAYEYLGSLRTILGRIWSRRFRDLGAVIRGGLSMQLNAVEVIESFVPNNMPRDFADLDVPFQIVATDLHTWHQVVLLAGPLIPSIAASVAIPSVFKPLHYEGRVLVDGSVVNPLPLDCAHRGMDIVIAIDVSGVPQDYDESVIPSQFEIGWRSAQIMMHSLAANSLAAYPPTVYARPHVKDFGAMEFWRVKEIVEAGQDQKDLFKRQVAQAVEDFIVSQQRSV
ncbi:MAG: patatin-like phospholipase family protein [Hyphomicrobiaceae bacterium]|nr:patatin-like phospholipase family protein [Hyphomicrobiaceae bacterium]MCC0023007.1 patatin-like phospholipase family protein [Hyphomicrobiaceae bacterium]